MRAGRGVWIRSSVQSRLFLVDRDAAAALIECSLSGCASATW